MLGRPVAHSLSPLLHRAAYAELGLDWDYTAIDCGVDELTRVLEQHPDSVGFSCTMPLKHAVVEVAQQIAPVAARVGVANTLVPGPFGWIAENTDVAGIVAALAEHPVAPRSATLLGAGGTAQAALAALLAIGVEECTVLVRDASRTAALRATAERLGVRVRLGSLSDPGTACEADLIVSTLPAGAADPLAALPWRSGQAVLDVCYSPWPTPLAAAAQAGGARVVSGALMLLHQAAVQVSLMTGRDAPESAMRLALAARLPDAGL